MKNIYKIIASLVLIFSILLIYPNRNLPIEYTFFGNKILSNLGGCMSLLYCLGIITFALFTAGSVKSQNLKSKEFEKKLDKNSVDMGKDKAKIKALEQKVLTLEKALEKKLKD